MPDDDYIPRRVPRPYRHAFDMAVAATPARIVGDEIRSSLTRDLRDSGGCAGIPQLARAARDLVVFEDEEAWELSRVHFLDLNEHKPVAIALLKEAEASVATDPEAVRDAFDDGFTLQLTERGLDRYVTGSTFGRARNELLELFPSYAAARDFEQRAMSGAALAEIAVGLLAHDDGVGLRAPRSRIEREPMAQLLQVNLAPEENQ